MNEELGLENFGLRMDRHSRRVKKRGRKKSGKREKEGT